MSLHICEVTKENWRSVAALSVSEQQKHFIENNAFSLAECMFENYATSLGLYDEETLVGYAMYGWPNSVNKSAWLDRFMIDYRFQGNGYAKRFLPLLIVYIQQQYDCKKIYLSLHTDNIYAQKLYESFGFCLNGEIDDEGPVVGRVMELNIEE
ncbi:GNAT family N-acetyltransferase [Paenibacillus sp. IHBB 10380]|uniref:GNAT family N-acetyltransferase n=1 Tax=Paenibacillus sp. IHBB 10380 TaxID=1566358 RepID=UPI0005CFD7C4|nr:GNAT family N-acetyltransferase [Paenibacillus sp. IHBB 10380]AJS60199.1 spermidine acetyltransferase [Paenibacillus sp. IHBB 10380]